MTESAFVEKVSLTDTFITRVLPGQDLFARVKEIMHEAGLERIVILSAVGSLVDIEMRDLKEGIEVPVNLDKTNLIRRAGPFELLTLEGSGMPLESDTIVHFHATLGTPEGAVIGGHLFAATCFTTVEIVFAGLKGSQVQRHTSEVTGLTEMVVPD